MTWSISNPGPATPRGCSTGHGWSSGFAATIARGAATPSWPRALRISGEFVTIGELLQIFRRSCPNSPEMRERRQQKYGVKCTGYVADLGAPPPPDLPPAMAAWAVIDGGKKLA